MTSKEIIANIKGVFVPSLAPFGPRGEVNLKAFRHNLRACLKKGLAGAIVLGSTGETPYLNEREKLSLLEVARDVIRPPQLLVAGTGLESTPQTIAFSREAIAGGADALLVLTPAYYKAYMTPAVLENHYRCVADALTRPILIYSIPQFTGIHIEPATIGKLSRHKNIVGLKESSGNTKFLKAILQQCQPKFRALVGSPLIFVEALQAGAAGAILGNVNYVPAVYVKIYDYFCRGEIEAAKQLQQRFEPVVREINARLGIPGIKYAADLCGYRGGAPRPPLLPLRPAERRIVAAALKKAKVPLMRRGSV